MTDLRPDIGPALAAFGLPATVTLPGEAPITTTAIWLSPMPVETPGVLAQTDRPQAVLSLARADVPDVPRGTEIEVAEIEGGSVLSWTVEAILGEIADEVRVLVIPAAS